MSSVKQNIGSDERMCLRCRPFRWSCGGVEAKHVALPDAACPGLLRKPLEATTGRLLTPYCPGCRQGDNQQNDDAKHTYFAGRFDGHRDAPVRYREYRQMEEVRGSQSSH
jgi:hypothetical protein